MAAPLQIHVLPASLVGLKTPRLDTFLTRSLSESRSFLQNLILGGRIRVNGVTVLKAGHLVRVGDRIEGELEPTKTLSHATPIAAPLDVLFEDAFLLAINKPQGLVIHPAPSHSGETLVHHLLHYLQNEAIRDLSSESAERPGIVHRLDKGTSGVLLIAKNRKTQEALSSLFKERKIKKTYEALAWGKMRTLNGRFHTRIGRDRIHRRKMSSKSTVGREAVTDWKVLQTFGHFTWIEMHPLTGRTHQLRVHLSESGHPVVGDPTYGRGMTEARRKSIPPRLQGLIEKTSQTFLHAARLEFPHPETGALVRLTAARPPAFDELLSLLRQCDE